MTRELTSLALREAIRKPYGMGGYEIVGIASDGGLLCHKCMRAEYYQVAWERRHKVNGGWRVMAICANDTFENGERCDHCATWLDAYNDEGETV